MKNLSADNKNANSITIVSKEGMVEKTRMLLVDGQIISTEKNNIKNNVVKFEQLNIDLKDLQTGIIKVPKMQETNTLDLFECWLKLENSKMPMCKEEAKKEITTVLNRRIFFPFYLPVIAVLCSLLLIKNRPKKNFFNQYSIFALAFLVLLSAELSLRYTGIMPLINYFFILFPIFLIPITYLFLIYKFKGEY